MEQLARETRWHLRQGKIKAFEFLAGSVFGPMSALTLSLNAPASCFTEPVSRQAVDPGLIQENSGTERGALFRALLSYSSQ